MVTKLTRNIFLVTRNIFLVKKLSKKYYLFDLNFLGLKEGNPQIYGSQKPVFLTHVGSHLPKKSKCRAEIRSSFLKVIQISTTITFKVTEP